MEKKILVMNSDEGQCQDICTMLAEEDYDTVPVYSIAELETQFENNECQAVIMDIDSVLITNRTIRQLALKYPGTYFLCLSKDRFHPDLKEALCYHIYACIKKPVDPDELYYWAKSIYK